MRCLKTQTWWLNYFKFSWKENCSIWSSVINSFFSAINGLKSKIQFSFRYFHCKLQGRSETLYHRAEEFICCNWFICAKIKMVILPCLWSPGIVLISTVLNIFWQFLTLDDYLCFVNERKIQHSLVYFPTNSFIEY